MDLHICPNSDTAEDTRKCSGKPGLQSGEMLSDIAERQMMSASGEPTQRV